MNVLEIDPGLEAVAPADQREVVDELCDPLLEVLAVRRRVAELDGVGDVDRDARRRIGDRVALRVPLRILHADLIQAVGAPRRDELGGRGIHGVREVERAFDGGNPATAAVVRIGVLEPVEPGAEPVRVADPVVELADEETDILVRRRHGRLRRQAHLLHERRIQGDDPHHVPVGPFEADVVVQLVLDDGPAHVGGPGVHFVGRPVLVGPRQGEVERKRAEPGLAEPVTDVALQPVGAGRGDGVVHEPHRLAEFRRVAARRDLHFADRDLGHRHQAQPGAILLRVGIAVDLVVDAQERAVRAEARHAEFGVLEPADSRLQQREIVRVARHERQVLDFAFVEVAAHVNLAQIDDSRIGRDADDLGQRSHRHHHVDDRRRPRVEEDVGLLVLLEPGEFRRDAVGAERQQHRAVDALAVGDDGTLGARVVVVHRHRDARQDAAGNVLDRSFNRTVDRG